MLRRVAFLVVVASLAALAPATYATAATAAPDVVRRLNAERTARGLRALAVPGDLTAVAQRHSGRMAERRSLYHNPNLGSEVSGWRRVGENVGYGGDVAAVHRAFMDSPAHRDNVLDPAWTEVGAGTVTDSGGVLWVTVVFRLPVQVSTPAPAPASRPAIRRTRPAPAAPRPPATEPATEPATRPELADPRRAVLLALARAAATRAGDALTDAIRYVGTMAVLAR